MSEIEAATRYQILVKVIDQLGNEAPGEYKSYHPPVEDFEALNAARSKAFIHLFLKVYFGLIDFAEREEFVTEGVDDGGIDAYYIDRTRKIIYFIQSKFRRSEQNFEEKNIEAEDLLKMDIDRILKGENCSESGQQYNKKIKTMASKISEIEDIGRYSYRVIILANAKGVTRQKINMLTGGYQTQLFDYAETYSKLLFPLVSGSFFKADALHLALNLSNKNAASKISYTALTLRGKCEITVAFVPTLEVAKAMFLYRNAILDYNPRSYLEFEGQNVNEAIRDSILSIKTNEFALFNNGITILSDETYLNERIGQKDRAQLTMINPQIINGGQTAYVLSQIYKENRNSNFEELFGEKEVLVKIITFDHSPPPTEDNKRALIEAISRATNSQTVVTRADRRSNEPAFKQLQHRVFDQLGIFLERKRGEFSDGIREGYISNNDIVDRNIFVRAALVAQGRLREATLSKIVVRLDFQSILGVPDNIFKKYGVALVILSHLHQANPKFLRALDSSAITQTWVTMNVAESRGIITLEKARDLITISDDVAGKWADFRQFYVSKNTNSKFHFMDKRGIDRFHQRDYEESDRMRADAIEFFCLELSLKQTPTA